MVHNVHTPQHTNANFVPFFRLVSCFLLRLAKHHIVHPETETPYIFESVSRSNFLIAKESSIAFVPSIALSTGVMVAVLFCILVK